MDIHIDIPKEWIQWFLVMVGIMLAKAIFTLIFDFEPYPMWRPSDYIRDREWVRLAYWFIDDIGDAVVFLLLLRAVGLVKFL